MHISFSFILVCVGFTIFWITVHFYLRKVSPSLSAKAACETEKNMMLLQGFHLATHNAECQHILNEVKSLNAYNSLPLIYVITPTYARPVQKAELTRLSHTLLLVPNIHWIVVEDSENKTELVTNFLHNCGIKHTHLNVPTPPDMKMIPGKSKWSKPRGVSQRNEALYWLRQHLTLLDEGVVYFADDDNTYDLQLFEEMRFTHKVSVWPVGLVGGLMVERPLVKDGRVVGWNAKYKPGRPFPIDMAGFAINLTLLLQHRETAFNYSLPQGYQESNILKSLVTLQELEPKAADCTKAHCQLYVFTASCCLFGVLDPPCCQMRLVLVWHTRTVLPDVKDDKNLTVPSNTDIEV